MTAFAVLLSILAAIAIGAMSPGPSFVLVSRIAVVSSRSHGLASALGMGVGGAFFAALAVLGLTALLMQFEWLYLMLKILGGGYLIYLAIKIWRGASEPLAPSGTSGENPGHFRFPCLPARIDDAAQQPQDLDRLRQHFRGANAALAADMAALCPAANNILRGSGLVHHRCGSLLRVARSADLCPLEAVDRPGRWRCDGCAGAEADGRGFQGENLIKVPAPERQDQFQRL